MVERWFRDLTDKAIRRGVFHSVNELVTAIEDYLKANNDDPKPFIWTATAEQILAKVARGRVTPPKSEKSITRHYTSRWLGGWYGRGIWLGSVGCRWRGRHGGQGGGHFALSQ